MFDFSGIFGVERFKIWCQKVLPTVYDDSLSYMELLCKVLKVLEEYGNGSAEIAEQVVLLNEELATVKEDIARLVESGGKTDEQVGANTDAIAALGERVGVVEQQVVSIAESLVTVRDDITALDDRVSATEQQVVSMGESIDSLGETVDGKIGGKTAYLGEFINMEDVPADAVIVGGNGTEEEPYNAFEAGGSKEHGGWVRVGDEVIPESDFKMLEEILDGERGVEKAVIAERIANIDLSQYNDTDNIPVEFARAIGDDKCYAFILVQSGSLYPPCLYYISNDDGITQIAGRVNNALITYKEDYLAPEKTYGFYCGKLGHNFPQITVLAFNGNINFFVGEKRTSETLVENSKYLYFGKPYITDENANTLENFSRGANGLTLGQAETLKKFAVGETITINGNTEQDSFISEQISLPDGMYIITAYLRSKRAGLAGVDRVFTGLLNFLNKPNGAAAIGILFDPLLTCYFSLYDLNLGTLSLEGIGNFFELADDSVDITFYIRRIY